MSSRLQLPIRVYADTSVFGAVVDAEYFAAPSIAFFEMVRSGEFSLIISPTLDDEVKGAPVAVKELYSEMRLLAESSVATPDVFDLMQAYFSHSVLTPRWQADAIHVATATVALCKVIVSWNMRHIVNFKKIRLYNAVNLLSGYDMIDIRTPAEVIENEQD
jgi:hypothetical protein